MRIINRNIRNSVSFGYDKKLNSELKFAIKSLPDKQWAQTLSNLNSQCNKLEAIVDKYSRSGCKKTDSKYNDYLDLFLSLKQMLVGFIAITFEGLKFPDREYMYYKDEYINNGAKKDSWQNEVCEVIACWTDGFQPKKVVTDPIIKEQDTVVEKPKLDVAEKPQAKGDMQNKNKSLLEEYMPTSDSPKGFLEVMGMSDLKQDLKEGILDNIADPELADRDLKEYGISIPKGILMFGPPGCGKTYITEALASEAQLPLYKFNISKAGSSFINMTSKNIQAAFDEAIKIAEDTGKPCLLFMDEIDTLGFDRNSRTDNEDMKQVGTMLQAIDKAQKHNVILIGATNKYNLLDPAIIRRFENPYYVDLPDSDAIGALLNKILSGISKGKNLLDSEEDMTKLIKLLSGYSNKSICIISANAAKLAKRRNRADISVNDYIESIKISAQEKPDKRDYLPDSRKNQSIGFKFT